MSHADVDLKSPPRRRYGCVALIRNHERKVLLVKRNYGDGKWILPGGGAHEGENIVDAVRREVREKTGLSLPLSHVVAVDQVPFNPANDVAEGMNFVFSGGILTSEQAGTVTLPSGGELAAYAWVRPEELPLWVRPYQAGRIGEALVVAEAGGGMPALARGVPV